MAVPARRVGLSLITALGCWCVAAPRASAQSWLLVYSGGPNHGAYTVQKFSNMLYSPRDAGSRPLFNGILCLETHGWSGHAFNRWGPDGPPPESDYFGYLDTIFAPHGTLAAADSVAAMHSDSLLVAIMLPYPLGKRGGQPVVDTRIDFVERYLRRVEVLFRIRRYRGLRLWGFYWFSESVTEPDTAIVQIFSSIAHSYELKTVWIPYLTAPLASRWRKLGFDEAFLQPNYFIIPEATAARVDTALADASSWGMGLEVEFDRRLFTSTQQFAPRLDGYLAALERSPTVKLPGVAVYDGGGALTDLATTSDDTLSALYSRLVAILRRY